MSEEKRMLGNYEVTQSIYVGDKEVVLAVDKKEQYPLRYMEWVYCPICKNKTRTKIRKDTELINFPLFCPKCKQESVINVTKQKITVVEPDAKTQSR